VLGFADQAAQHQSAENIATAEVAGVAIAVSRAVQTQFVGSSIQSGDQAPARPPLTCFPRSAAPRKCSPPNR